MGQPYHQYVENDNENYTHLVFLDLTILSFQQQHSRRENFSHMQNNMPSSNI
jgi:hypothetical protein